MEASQHLVGSVELAWAAASFEIDVQTATVTKEFHAAGIRSILLKGPVLAEWLYKGRAIRAYADSDLLVSPRDWDRAVAVLRRLGFQDGLEGLGHPRMESTASYPWIKGTANLDLHSTLWGIHEDPEKVWRVLSAQTQTMRVGGRTVEVLGLGPRALHVALHAAQHGPIARKPMADLITALEVAPSEVWRDAAVVAAELKATAVFATALKYTADGAAMARRLGIADKDSVEALLRGSQVPLVEGFEELSKTRGLLPKLRLIKRELMPSAEFMRWWTPVARRGSLGLIAAYLWRPVWFVWRAIPGYLAWRRAHKRGVDD